MADTRADYDLMVRAAWMYYHDDLTQAQIARKLRLSRVKVTRLLAKARSEGVVEIRVTQPMPPDLETSREIEAAFDLMQAVVVPSATPEAVGQAAANVLHYAVSGGERLGFGWSSTVSQLEHFLHAQSKPCGCVVVDLVGSMLGKANPYSVSGKVADALGAVLLPLAVPVMVSTPEARDTLLAESRIAETLATARRSDIAFVGVGEVGPTSTMVELGFIPPEDMANLQRRGVVGEMLMRYFDANGEPVPNEGDDRIIGLTLADLHAIPNVVVVATGEHKVPALLGALRSGIPQTLITDMTTAQSLLAAT